jgi:SAM-dependent methyltransferase
VTNASKLDAIAPTYRHEDLLGLNELYHLAMRDRMIAPQGGTTALEIGCGGGSWTKVLCERYQRVDVVEGSRDLLDRVVVENGHVRARVVPHHAVIEDFAPPANERWQHIYMTFLLEHLADPVGTLRRIGGWLQDGGRLIVAVPNANSLHRVLALRMGLIQRTDELSENDRRVGHYRVYSRSLLQEQITHAGFRIVVEASIGLKPFTLKQMEHLPSAVGQALADAGDLAPEYAAYIGVQAEFVR